MYRVLRGARLPVARCMTAAVSPDTIVRDRLETGRAEWRVVLVWHEDRDHMVFVRPSGLASGDWCGDGRTGEARNGWNGR